MNLRKPLLLFILAASLQCIPAGAQVRETISIPDIPGYLTLKFDPHIHTVFSDGLVWPTVRVHEAWREGLDIISITDHIEYRPFHSDIPAGHNRSYEIARPLAERMGIMLIQGSEITRGMPPGHFNAIFIHDAGKLDVSDWREAMIEARDQDAFIFWNHPGWDRQQPDTTLWWEEHTWLYEQGLMHGIEVVNGPEYFPEAHQWCLEKGLSMLGSSDIHNPIGMDYDLSRGQRRSMTLVFARENSMEGVREALHAGRTAVYFDDKLAGREEYLKALFEQSLVIESVEKTNSRLSITLYNRSDIPIILSKVSGNDPELEFFRQLNIPARGYRNAAVYMKNTTDVNSIELKLRVENFLSEPGNGMEVVLVINAPTD